MSLMLVLLVTVTTREALKMIRQGLWKDLVVLLVLTGLGLLGGLLDITGAAPDLYQIWGI